MTGFALIDGNNFYCSCERVFQPKLENVPLVAFLFGELDTETGYSHLWHAACCLMFLIAYEARGSGTDDRFKPTTQDIK